MMSFVLRLCRSSALIVLCFGACLADGAEATSTLPDLCGAAKQRISGSYARCLGRSQALARLVDGHADAMACDSSLVRAFRAIEAWGLPCELPNDDRLQRAGVAQCIDSAVATIHASDAANGIDGETARCDAVRIRAAGRYLQCMQRHAAAARVGLGFTEDGADRCRAKLHRAYARGAQLSTCSASAGPSAVQERLDTCRETLDPDLAVYEGEVVVITRHPDGHPREVGVAIVRAPDSVWTIDGRERIYFGEGALARALADDAGHTVRVRGTVQLGIEFLRTIYLASYELDDEVAVAPLPEAITADVDAVGTIVVLDRHDGGHPRTLAIAPVAGEPVVLADSNKSSELRYRIGRQVRIEGSTLEDGSVRVLAYEDRQGSPLVSPGDGYRWSFLAGSEDENGRLMGGVEVDALLAFDGKIFAGTSLRRNTQIESPDPDVSSQVLVLDRPDGRWRVDFEVPANEAGDAPRIVFLDTVRFATDFIGRPLPEPATFLAAVSGGGEIYLRSAGAAGDWVATGLQPVVRAAAGARSKVDARSIVAHTDAITGISHLFAGAGVGRSGAGGGIYRGAYDPDRPGHIVWAAAAEYVIPDARPNPRVMGLTTAHGEAYASLGTLLLRRRDGPAPSWTEVFRDVREAGNDSIRRATAVAGPTGGASLLFGVEGPNCRAVRLDIDAGDAATEEVFLNREVPGGFYGAVAYNGPSIRRLEGGSEAAILGAMVFRPAREDGVDLPDLGRVYDFTDGMFLWRDADGLYSYGLIRDRTLEVHPPLVGVRSVLAHSPFPGEEEVVYFSGFDHNRHLWHNTGWVFKAHLDDVRADLEPFRDLDATLAAAGHRY